MQLEFKKGDLMLLYNSRLKLFPGKLKSRWSRLFKVTQVFSFGAVEIWSEKISAFKVNKDLNFILQTIKKKLNALWFSPNRDNETR
jgi:hypothetical protein